MLSNKSTLRLCAIAVTSVLFAGCTKTEPVRDIAYFQGLGLDKTLDTLRSCQAEKKALMNKKDAEGLDQLAKSPHYTNCRTAFKFATGEEAKNVDTTTSAIDAASTAEDVKQLQEKVVADINARWHDIGELSVEFANMDGNPIGREMWVMNAHAAKKLSHFAFASFGNSK